MNQARRDPYIDFCGILRQFAHETYNQLDDGNPEKEKLKLYLHKIDESFKGNKDEAILNVVKPVVRSFKSNSKDILFRNGCMFTNELRMFDDSTDVAKLWRKQNTEGKKVMWEFIEQLYVIGYILCYPDKKTKFLQLVSAMKSQASNGENSQTTVTDEPDTHVESVAPAEGSEVNTSTAPTGGNTLDATADETQQAVNDINQMFGLQQGDVMTEMVGDIALQVNGMMQDKSPEEQQQMFMKMIQGDMSMFEGMMQNIGAQLEQRIERGEVDRDALEQQAQSMVGQFQGMQQQMGGQGGLGGLGGLMNMMGGMGMPQMPPQQSQQPRQNTTLNQGMQMPSAEEMRQAQQMMQQMGMPQFSEQDMAEAQRMMQQMGMGPSHTVTQPGVQTKKKKKDKKKGKK